VCLEASTKPHVHRKFEIYWTNITSTMAYPNFKNGSKKGLGPLGDMRLNLSLVDKTEVFREPFCAPLISNYNQVSNLCTSNE
jgi:hypothetical protein